MTVEDNTAGMVWAPEAIWDASKGTPHETPYYDVAYQADLETQASTSPIGPPNS